jgi:DNA-binding MarR family transcriptional regulator
VSASEPEDEHGAPHPSTALTEVVHQRTRLGILSVLAESGRADFTYLKSALQLTDGNLGRHLEILAGEGLIEITKGYEGRRPRTWAKITKVGQSALSAQMAAMKELVNQFEARQSLRSVGGASQRKPGGVQLPPRHIVARAKPRLSGA